MERFIEVSTGLTSAHIPDKEAVPQKELRKVSTGLTSAHIPDTIFWQR